MRNRRYSLETETQSTVVSSGGAVINGTWAKFLRKLSGPPARPTHLGGKADPAQLIDQELMRQEGCQGIPSSPALARWLPSASTLRIHPACGRLSASSPCPSSG